MSDDSYTAFYILNDNTINKNNLQQNFTEFYKKIFLLIF